MTQDSTRARLKQPLTVLSDGATGKGGERVKGEDTNGALTETAWGQSQKEKRGKQEDKTINCSTHSAWWRQAESVLFSSCAS